MDEISSILVLLCCGSEMETILTAWKSPTVKLFKHPRASSCLEIILFNNVTFSVLHVQTEIENETSFLINICHNFCYSNFVFIYKI